MQSRGFLGDAALVAGHDLGAFEALARGGPASVDQLAGALGVVAGTRRLRSLLDVLAALGAIACDRSSMPPRFAAVAVAPPRPTVERAGWGLLADVIRRDWPLPIEGGDGGEAERRLHHHLASAGASPAAELAGMLGTTSLLDLGAGAGAYSKAFLLAQPAGRATLVDTPDILALAAEWLGPLADRARFVDGDASVVDAGTGHDAVLLANLLHLHSPAMCARLCVAAAHAVAPGGVVVIKDLRVDDDRTGPLEGLLFALNMAIYTEAGDVYSTSQLRAWLADAGLVDITERRLAAAPDAVVVTGRRASEAESEAVSETEAEAVSETETEAGSETETEAGTATEMAAGTATETATGTATETDAETATETAAETATETEAETATETGAGTATETAAETATETDAGTATEMAAGTATEIQAAAGAAAEAVSEAACEGVAAELDAALARTAGEAWRELVATQALHAGAAATGVPALAFPSPLRQFLAAAVALERSEGGSGSAERASNLVRHYTDAMPRIRVAQLAGTSEPGATMFHTPLDWTRLPRLGTAIDRLFAMLADAGLEAAGALGAPSADAFRARTPTLAALYERTHYGGFMPLLYGFPADLAYFHARGVAERRDVLATIDRYLTAPIVHELCHFAPGRIAVAPPHLDECIAGWLGVHVHPELAYPTGDHDDALYAAPWLAQVGQAIARAFGVANLVRAHVGGDHAALPHAFVTCAARLGWDDWRTRRTLHFLSDTFDPAPWVALALACGSIGAAPSQGAAGNSSEASLQSLAAIPLSTLTLPEDPDFDREIVEDGLRAMCLASAQVAGSFRTRTQLPDGPIAIDAVACAVIAPRRGELDPVLPRYWLPPAVAARIAAQHRGGYDLRLGSVTAIPAAAAAICDASPGLGRAGFALSPRW
jgi:hypothetical protein